MSYFNLDLDKEFLGKRIVITGASKGLGATACKAFAERGAKIAMLSRSKIAMNKLKSRLSNPSNHISIKVDLLNNKEIILTNGTTVFGKIVYQDRDVVKVETLIGKLIIDRSDIVRVVENIIDEETKEETETSISPDQIEIIEVQNDDDESGINIIERRKENQTASLVLIGDIKENKDKSGNTILNGEIKNIGTQRADFAKINITFRKNWHGDVETLTAFVRGSYYTFKTGVSSDSSILPGAIAEFELIVPKSLGSFIGYSYTVDWEQYE